MAQCSECREAIQRTRKEPDIASIAVCFSCYIDDATYVRNISIAEEENWYELRIQTDYGDGNWWYSCTFESQQEAMEFGELVVEKLSRILIAELTFSDNNLIFGFRNSNDTNQFQEILETAPLAKWVADIQLSSLSDLYSTKDPEAYDGRPLITQSLCWKIAMWRGYDYPDEFGPGGRGLPLQQERFTLQDIPFLFNTSRGLSSDVIDSLHSHLKDLFIDGGGFDSVKILINIKSATYEMLPVAAHIFPQLRYDLQRYARENPEILSPRSRRGMKRNEAGKQLEETFRGICSDYGLNHWSGGKVFSIQSQLQRLQDEPPEYLTDKDYEERLNALNTKWRELPMEARSIAELVDSRSGFPDFVVWGEQGDLDSFINDFANGIERKCDVLLVEVKFRSDPNDSAYFTPAQEELLPKLQKTGADVYVFRGTGDEKWLKRPSF